MMQLRVITPKKVVMEREVKSVTAPTVEGEVTILPHHSHLFAMLQEGVVTVRDGKSEDAIAIGGGYLETDGASLTLLVSRAYGQDEIDAHLTEKAVARAKEILVKSKDRAERDEATILLRRSLIDMKLLRRKRRV